MSTILTNVVNLNVVTEMLLKHVKNTHFQTPFSFQSAGTQQKQDVQSLTTCLKIITMSIFITEGHAEA